MFNPEVGEKGLVMPNPADDEITFYSPGSESGLMTILTQHGQVVRQLQNYAPGTSIFVGDLPSNIYVLQFGNRDKQISKKVIIR